MLVTTPFLFFLFFVSFIIFFAFYIFGVFSMFYFYILYRVYALTLRRVQIGTEIFVSNIFYVILHIKF